MAPACLCQQRVFVVARCCTRCTQNDAQSAHLEGHSDWHLVAIQSFHYRAVCRCPALAFGELRAGKGEPVACIVSRHVIHTRQERLGAQSLPAASLGPHWILKVTDQDGTGFGPFFLSFSSPRRTCLASMGDFASVLSHSCLQADCCNVYTRCNKQARLSMARAGSPYLTIGKELFCSEVFIGDQLCLGNDDLPSRCWCH